MADDDAGRRRHRRTDRRPAGRVPTPGRPRRRLVDRLVAGRRAGSWAIVQDALAAGLDPDDALPRGARARRSTTIGERWAEGVIIVGQEHQASVVVLRLIGRLGPLLHPTGSHAAARSCSARPPATTTACRRALFADLLRGVGFGVIDLGADTPTASFVDAARRAERLLAVARQRHHAGRRRRGASRRWRGPAGRGRRARSSSAAAPCGRAEQAAGAGQRRLGAPTTTTRWRCSRDWPTMRPAPRHDRAPRPDRDTTARSGDRGSLDATRRSPDARQSLARRLRRPSTRARGHGRPELLPPRLPVARPALRLDRPDRAADARQGRHRHRRDLGPRVWPPPPAWPRWGRRCACSGATSGAPRRARDRIVADTGNPDVEIGVADLARLDDVRRYAAADPRATTTGSTCSSTTPARSCATTS